MRIAGMTFPSRSVYSTQHKTVSEKEDKSSEVKTTEVSEKIKNTSSLPDQRVEAIQKQAMEDAKKGVYMSQKFIDSNLAYMRNNVSPNRAKLISMFNPKVMNAKYTGKPASLFSIPGFSGFTARFSVGPVFGAYMTIWNDKGEEILSYSPPPNGGWCERQTRAEHKYLDEAKEIYMKAYDEVRAQMKAGTAPSGFDIQV